MKKAFIVKSEQGYKKLNLTKTIQLWEDGLRTTGKRGEYEWWYYDAKMDDGSTLVITFFTTNPTNTKGGFNPNIKIEFTRRDGSKVSDLIYVDKKDCYFNKNKCEVKMKDNFFIGDLNKYYIYVRSPKIEANIELSANVKSWRPETGFQQFGEKEYFAWLPSVPEGKTKATIRIDNSIEEFLGTGYHDHNWGNTSMLKLLHHWYWGRAKVGPYTVISCFLTTVKKYGYTKFPIFMIANEDKLICDDANNINFYTEEKQLSNTTGKWYDNKLVYDYNGVEGHYKITYVVKEIISSFSLLEDEGKKPQKFKRTLVNIFGLDPTYDRFNGEVIFEKIENNVVVEKHVNNATWELMHFRKDKKNKQV
ncbi:hydroxyneurosporene dehydrogenase [Malacoplasma penetrans]|nr:hypothetical protein [Malacoplasma penetrans]RXY96507.1 hydroxyneurosporene dehydrogenase [Malacoplasma penetrans]